MAAAGGDQRMSTSTPPPLAELMTGPLVDQVLHLALLVQDDPGSVSTQLDEIADARMALVVAAALIHVDEPVRRWWRPGGCQRCGGETGRPGHVRYCEQCRLACRRGTFVANSRRQREKTRTARQRDKAGGP
jgi:hypothetical protein